MKTKKIVLGKDNPKRWRRELLEMDKFLNGKPAKYWHRVVYSSAVTEKEVKALRSSFKLTQLGLAQALGTSLSTIRSWEQGTKKPVGLARKVLRVLQKEPRWLQSLVKA